MEFPPAENLYLEPSYRLEGPPGDQHILRVDGRKYDLGDELLGEVESIGAGPPGGRAGRGGGISIRGWAHDHEGQAFESVLVFHGDQLLGAIENGVARRDIALRYGFGRGKVGFSAALEPSLLGKIAAPEIRVMALRGEAATVLPVAQPGH